MRSPKGQGIKRLNREEVELLGDSIRKYRILAGQLSNVCFNLSQKLRTPENGYEDTLKLVRDYDACDRDLCLVLKDTQLYKHPDS